MALFSLPKIFTSSVTTSAPSPALLDSINVIDQSLASMGNSLAGLAGGMASNVWSSSSTNSTSQMQANLQNQLAQVNVITHGGNGGQLMGSGAAAQQVMGSAAQQAGNYNVLGAQPFNHASLDFTVDLVFAAVEKHLRKLIHDEITKSLSGFNRTESDSANTVLAARLPSGDSQ